jgi:hypothetical protein
VVWIHSLPANILVRRVTSETLHFASAVLSASMSPSSCRHRETILRPVYTSATTGSHTMFYRKKKCAHHVTHRAKRADKELIKMTRILVYSVTRSSLTFGSKKVNVLLINVQSVLTLLSLLLVTLAGTPVLSAEDKRTVLCVILFQTIPCW